jgi:hypothetical protein
MVGDDYYEKTEEIGEKTTSVPLCLPHIPLKVT